MHQVEHEEALPLRYVPAPRREVGWNEFIPVGSRFVDLPDDFRMKSGGHLHHARIAFETFGRLSEQRDNAILICTGLSPDAHVASRPDDPTPGWWEQMVGPDKPVDTKRWFVICVNSLGSCKGSTGPASVNPATGRPYGLAFPEVSVEDIADAAAIAVLSLGIERLACVIGASMGGMVALSLLDRHPGIARTHVNVSGAPSALPFAIATRSLQREAIREDPDWRRGNYDRVRYPRRGMIMARKLGVITYRSACEWRDRFGRDLIDADARIDLEQFRHEFEIESYLEYQARRFVGAFDPNCYLYLSRAIDRFDLGDGRRSLAAEASSHLRLESAMVLGVTTDILFPLEQQEDIARRLEADGVRTRLEVVDSPKGHDAFLVDIPAFGVPIADYLAEVTIA